MEVLLNQFLGYNVKAPDGFIGKIRDFYFHERSWQVRYIMLDTGDWLDKDITISPFALLEANVATQVFPVRTTRQKIELRERGNNVDVIGDHLDGFRSTQSTIGSALKSPEAMLGKVFDYIIEDTNWEIRYLVIEVVRSKSKKVLLMNTQHLFNVDWLPQTIDFNL